MCNWRGKKGEFGEFALEKSSFSCRKSWRFVLGSVMVVKDFFWESRSPLSCNLDNLSMNSQELTVTLIKLAFKIAKGVQRPWFLEWVSCRKIRNWALNSIGGLSCSFYLKDNCVLESGFGHLYSVLTSPFILLSNSFRCEVLHGLN